MPLLLAAQFNYVLDSTIPVHDLDARKLSMPWAGGINASQYNTLDLNGDDQPDLVLFDRMANKVLTYLNVDQHYVYAAEYESLFPKNIANWILLRDYNCDGRKDLFTSDVLGIRVYANTTEPGELLSWRQIYFFASPGQRKSEVLLTKGFNGLINLQLQYDDLPAIVDADGDGDLDIFNMQYSGNTIEFHKNVSNERHQTCDSLVFERVTQQWGGVTDCGCGNFALNGTPCPLVPGGRTEHVGGKSILMLDVDGDADLDFIYSESTCNNLYLLKNDGTTENPLINNHSNFPSSSPVNFYIFPAAYYEDVDFDGVKDVIATPNIFSKTFFNTDLASSNWFYKNKGTSQNPNLTLTTKNFLQDEMIDVGDNAIPAFADFDADGDLDLFISQHSTPAFTSAIYLYQNIGSRDNPEFKLATKDYLGFSLTNFYNLKIQFADITSDNKIDLIFTAGSFQTGTTKIYYLSDVFHASSQSIQTLNIDVVPNDNVHFADVIGNDGKLDALIGKNNGALELWGNDGNFNFTLKNASFLGISTSVIRQNPSCVIADLDDDKKNDLITSDQSGKLTIISNFLEANESSSRITEIVLSPLTDSTFIARNFGGRAWPTVANLYNTNKPNIVVGNILGGIQILKNIDGYTLTKDPVIQIYPNPAEKAQYITIKTDRDASVQIVSLLGQRIGESFLISGNKTTQYRNTLLASGVYLFRFTIGGKSYTKRVVIY